MATQSTNALITVDEFYAYADKDKSIAEINEPHLIAVIDAMSQAIEDYCDRVFCPVQSITELYDGDDEYDYYVRHRRFTADPTFYYWGGSDWIEMTAASYPRDTEDDIGRVFLTTGFVFGANTRYKIVYSTGWARGSVPTPVKLACFSLVYRAMLKAAGKEGVASESFADHNVSYNFEKWPDDVLMALSPYRRIMV